MWEYNYTDELMHYGVLGMKWGRRKARPTTSVGKARAAYKTAHKDYNKAFNKAYNYQELHPTAAWRKQGNKRRDELERLWDDAINKAEISKNTKKEYKAEKEAYKQTNEYKAKRKKAIKVGAAVAGTALAAYGAKKVYDIQKDNKARVRNEIARQTINRAMESYVNRPLYPGQLSRTVNTYYD